MDVLFQGVVHGCFVITCSIDEVLFLDGVSTVLRKCCSGNMFLCSEDLRTGLKIAEHFSVSSQLRTRISQLVCEQVTKINNFHKPDNNIRP